MPDARPYWERKSLADMSDAEWESLCDGCAKCCLCKLEDLETGDVSYTNIACRLLDLGTCRCTDYPDRKRQVPDCVTLTAVEVPRLYWLPSTCAYRLLADGEPLPDWHHLVSGDHAQVHGAGVSVLGKVVPEAEAGPPEHHIVDWPV